MGAACLPVTSLSRPVTLVMRLDLTLTPFSWKFVAERHHIFIIKCLERHLKQVTRHDQLEAVICSNGIDHLGDACGCIKKMVRQTIDK